MLFQEFWVRCFEAAALMMADGGHGLLSGVVEIVGGDDWEAALLKKLLADVHVGTYVCVGVVSQQEHEPNGKEEERRTFETNDQRDVELDFLSSIDDSLSDDVALHDATKNVHQNGLDLQAHKASVCLRTLARIRRQRT